MEGKTRLWRDPAPFDYARLMERVEALAFRFPTLGVGFLGSSILGRGIPILTVGRGEREVLYVGAHHGMEWITSLVLMGFLQDLCDSLEHRGNILGTEPSRFLDRYTLLLIPMLNPDGVEYQIHGVTPENPLYERVVGMNGGLDFSAWQANARGVDLNHNYDAGFEEYKRLEAEEGIKGGRTRYSGECAESEPEVAYLCNRIRFSKRLFGILTLHTQGEEIFYRSGGRTVEGSERIARRLGALTGYQLSEAQGLASYGGLTDWCVQKIGIPSFTLECGKGVNPLPQSQAFSIYARLREALFAFPTLLG